MFLCFMLLRNIILSKSLLDSQKPKKVEKIIQRFLKEEASSRCIQCTWASEAAAKYNDLVY